MSASSQHSGKEDSEENEVTYGQRLYDDNINTFCDRLQSVCPRKIDGLLAIQFLMIDPENIRKHISGKNLVLQVLFDRSREHYLLTTYDPEKRHEGIRLFDSMQRYEGDVPIISRDVKVFLRQLYGHLFPTEPLPVNIDRGYMQQDENWSCGYRVIASLLDVARGVDPATQEYGRRLIINFIKFVLQDPVPSWIKFKNIYVGRTKDDPAREVVRCLVSSTLTSSLSSSSITSRRSQAGRLQHEGEIMTEDDISEGECDKEELEDLKEQGPEVANAGVDMRIFKNYDVFGLSSLKRALLDTRASFCYGSNTQSQCEDDDQNE